MKIYAVYRNNDMTEGRGAMILDSIYTTRELAAEYADSKAGVMGRRKKWSAISCGDWEIREHEVLDDLPDNHNRIRLFNEILFVLRNHVDRADKISEKIKDQMWNLVNLMYS